jgi:hypothetical protein
MTWEFFDTYVDEAYAILAQDFLSEANKAPNGFDVAALAADLALVGQMESPPFEPPLVNPPPPTGGPTLAQVQACVDPAFASLAKDANHVFLRGLLQAIAAEKANVDHQLAALSWGN